jgi:geranylgeranyl pyrophosphate synthase
VVERRDVRRSAQSACWPGRRWNPSTAIRFLTTPRRWTTAICAAHLHKKTDDATAITAGDGLLTLAFDIITYDQIHRDPPCACC